MYIFRLTISREKSKLALFDGNEEVASREWGESRDMGKHLFRAIDELLVEQGLQPERVSGFEIDSDMPDGYTSMRIAETVGKTYMFAVQSKLPGKEEDLKA